MVKRIVRWLLCVGIAASTARSQQLEKNARPQVDLKPPINFRARQASAFPLYDNIFAGAYLKVGSRNPKWDADAQKALRLWSYDLCDRNCVVAGPEFFIMIDALRGALTNGCDDPLVLYMAVRMDEIKGTIHSSTPRLLQQDSHASYARIMEGFKSHRYPAVEQIMIHIRGVQDSMSYSAGDSIPTLLQNRSNWLAHAIDLVADVDFNRSPPSLYREHIKNLCENLWRVQGSKKGYDRIAAALEENKTCSKAISLSIKGVFYAGWAWEARGGGYADSVSEENRKLFEERLRVAQQSFEEASSLDPSNEYICTQMVKVSGAQGDMDRLETWFQRGKKIDPDDDELYVAKLNYLQPRWFGNEEDMLRFGRQCLKEGDWDSRVPFILLSSHYLLAGDTIPERRTYFAQPKVWNEIKPLFKTYLARRPLDYLRRTSYANYAAWAGDWDLVAQLIRELGTNQVSFAWEDPMLIPKRLELEAAARNPANLLK